MLATSFVLASLASVAAAAPNSKVHQHSRRFNSDNWCGAVLTYSGINSVEATWTVPTISIPPNGDAGAHYSEYEWIGMGGTSACSATGDLLQAGTGAEITNGDVTYYAYYQLFGSSGPMINTNLAATSSTDGTFYWENHTTGESSTMALQSNQGHSICTESVEWINERPGDPGNRRPFPDFTNFSFSGISAATYDGSTVNLDGAEDWILYRDQTPEILCHPSRTSSTSMDILRG
ncbi:hypothetical protein NLG97_g399 [Lecanicillium saksenae]|uniref:Uncharacterized protein n=1 Tax=Lecanicillium saksenae TaxID=468837 RepID=A0ACC1R8K8_9HYPO|nr:hypothetical protein NLG97_g399 [Lecanicillium saksenae]